MGYNRKIKDGTKRMLYIKSGNLCAWCKQTLVYSNSSNLSEIVKIGDAKKICKEYYKKQMGKDFEE